MLTRLWIAFGFLAVSFVACSDNGTGNTSNDEGPSHTDVRRRTPNPQDQGSTTDTTVPDLGEDEPDTAEPDVVVDVVEVVEVVEVIDLPSDPDLGQPEPRDAAPFEIPAATEDCEPLGIPTRWAGTFEGLFVSNIPDMFGYTFNGPASGAVSFEIRCVDTKLMVFGDLSGDTDCALDTGCPYTARMEGLYDPETRHIEGELLDGVIDYTVVQVYAEGEFEGDLDDDTTLSGTWSGEKTGISSPILSSVTATGDGTWEASPDES